MSQPLQIDFVSDVACPWCAVGLSSLQTALSRLGDRVDVKMAAHPFELNPDMPPEGEPYLEHIAKKYGRTPEQVEESRAALRERAADVGFTIGSRQTINNTFDAHRLLYWAGRTSDRQMALKMALLRAYHTDALNPADPAVLVDAARSVGLDGDEAARVLSENQFAAEVRADERKYQTLGIQSVPSIIFNGRYLVTGGQPPEAFEQIIQQVLEQDEARDAAS